MGQFLPQKQTRVGWGREKGRQKEEAAVVTFPEPDQPSSAQQAQQTCGQGPAASVGVLPPSATCSDGDFVVRLHCPRPRQRDRETSTEQDPERVTTASQIVTTHSDFGHKL